MFWEIPARCTSTYTQRPRPISVRIAGSSPPDEGHCRAATSRSPAGGWLRSRGPYRMGTPHCDRRQRYALDSGHVKAAPIPRASQHGERILTSRPAFGPRLYNHRWQRYRLGFLRQNPLCVRCLEAGRTTAANTVDHITPHRGDTALFWAKDNHQSLCAQCHSGDKQREEKSGVTSYRGSQADGTPLDPNHAWAR